MRINLACSKERIIDGLNRVESAINMYKIEKGNNEN